MKILIGIKTFLANVFDKPQAVAILIIHNNRILAVARRGTIDEWGLPGGKVEPGESLENAAIRELYEETGIKLSIHDLNLIYNNTDGSYDTYTFSASTHQKPSQGDAGPAKYVSPEELVAGPFGRYNKKLFNSIGININKTSVSYYSINKLANLFYHSLYR